LSILAKEGLEMLGHFLNMWCGKEMPCIEGFNLHRLASFTPKLRPDMSGIRHRPSYKPL
jgi:hypothetical protein